MTAARDPLVEAGRWLDARLAGAPIPRLLLVIGLGEGHLLHVLDKRAPETKVLALEPDPAAARAFLARSEWGQWLESGRLIYLVDPDYAGADQAWRIFPPETEAHLFLTHPSVDRQPTQGALRAARVMKDILFGVRANASARRAFAPRYLVNSLRNLPAIARGADLGGLKDAFAGLPAIVAGAGPSLNAGIEELLARPNRAIVIATDTAVRPMLDAGLAPQLAAGLDPSELNARHFEWLPEGRANTWLAIESALDHAAAQAFAARTFWFRVSDHHPWPWYNSLGVDAAQVEVWGSVLTAAFQVAVLAGCDPIVFIGSDLAYTSGRPYARATTYEFDWVREVAAGKDLQRVWREQMERAQDRVELPDVGGGTTTSTRTLQSFRDWLVARAARSGRRVINATGAGILLGERIEQASLADALPASVTIPPVSDFARVRPSRAPLTSLAAAARTARLAIERQPAASPISEWRAFCGDGFDAAAVAFALEAAAEQLEHDGGNAADGGLSPAAGLLGLPEREGVLRAALRGEPVPAWAQATAVFGSRGRQARRYDEAAAILLLLLQQPGSPIVPNDFGFFGADVQQRWALAVLDQRFAWPAPTWRTLLWDFHDAVALAIVSDSPPPANDDALTSALARLVDDIASAERAAVPTDLHTFKDIVPSGENAYNVLRGPAGSVAAAKRAGSLAPRTIGADAVASLAQGGMLLFAPPDAEIAARIERYLRHIVLIAIVRGWAMVIGGRAQASESAVAASSPEPFTTLLHRAAGVGTESFDRDRILTALLASAVPR